MEPKPFTYDLQFVNRLDIMLSQEGQLCITDMDMVYIRLLLRLYPDMFPDKLLVYLSLEGIC
jgi:hypothetical protein